MRTEVEIVARADPGGRTVLPVLRASGALAVRATGPGSVHLVGTAAGPLGGDSVTLTITVEAGARLLVRSAAAAVVLPAAAGAPSGTTVALDVAGALDLALAPTVVTARATHVATTTARLGPEGRLRLTERVVLGRAGAGPGRWTGTVRVERDGRPLLHTSQELGPGGAGWAAPFTPRAYAAELVLDGSTVDPAVGTDTVRLPLDGGWTATAWGAELPVALAGLDGLLPAAVVA
ncbi:MAG TPA: urease accessory protein UreD [Mycobacteriales bacterium]|nr:urease accessory protein UreD [Mycobacteriales bacterium]